MTESSSSVTIDATKEGQVENKDISNSLLIEDVNDVKSQDVPAEPRRSHNRDGSSGQRARAAVKQSEISSSNDTSSDHSEATLKLSNSWSSIGNFEGDTRETNVEPVRPQSSQCIRDNQTSVKKSKRSKSHKPKVRKTNPSSTTLKEATDGDGVSSDHGTWRPITSETKISSKRSATMIDKDKAKNRSTVEGMKKIASSGDKKRQSSKKSWEDCRLDSENKDDMTTLKSKRPSRPSTLERSSSVPSLEIESTINSSRAKRDRRHKDKDRCSSPRRKARSKQDILSMSEHHHNSSIQTQGSRKVSSSHQSSSKREIIAPDTEPETAVKKIDVGKSSAMGKRRSPTRDKQSQSDTPISKPKSAERSQLCDDLTPKEKDKNMEDRKKSRTRRQQKEAVRRSRSSDSLSQSEHIPSRPSQVGRGSFLSSSWGDLTLECESDSEISSLKRKKNWKAQCSWDLSQLIVMEELLSPEPEKESSTREKMKEALLALKKKITGSKEDDGKAKLCISMEDSCRNNVSLFDDSYQQHFGSTSIDFVPSGRRSSAGNTIPDGSTLDVIFDHENGFPLESQEWNNNEVNQTQHASTQDILDSNEPLEHKDSSKTSRTSDADGPGFGSQGSLLENRTMEVLADPETPNNQGSSSSFRRGRNKVRTDNREKKPSSWRELYKQFSPGKGTSSSQRRGASLVRKLSPKRLRAKRPNSLDEDIISPRTVTTVVFHQRSQV